MNYDELLREYGNEYLAENDPDSQLLEMDMLGEFLPQDPEDAFNAGMFAYGWWNGEKYQRNFQFNDEYFTFDGYAHIVSVPDAAVMSYLNMHVDEHYFLQWCEDNGYIDVED